MGFMASPVVNGLAPDLEVGAESVRFDLAHHRRTALRSRVVAGAMGLVGLAWLPFGLLSFADGLVMVLTDHEIQVGILVTIVATAFVGAVTMWRAGARARPASLRDGGGNAAELRCDRGRIYERLLRGSPESLVAHGLPKELDAVVRRGLSKAPHDRWESVDAFVSALRKETAGAHHVA